MNRRTCTQTKFAAACQRRCEIATRHQTRRKLNPSGEYGVVDEYSKRVPAQPIDAASHSVRANPLKRFVVSSARELKQGGRLRVPLRTRIAHTQVNITHFIAGESVFLSPLFLVVEPNQLRLDHVRNTSDGLITQISYRGLNSFFLKQVALPAALRNQNRMNATTLVRKKIRGRRRPLVDLPDPQLLHQIGRASCRERVSPRV